MGATGRSTDATAPRRLPELDVLRGAAALAVLLNHCDVLPLGWAGVDLFFVLSGYLITTGLLQRPTSLGAFYGRRARRILPLYVLHVGVAVAVGLHPVSQLAPLLLGLGNVFPLPITGQPLASGVLWSVAVEEHFYLVWPLLLLVAPRHWRAIGLAMWATSVVLRLCVVSAGVDPLYTARLTPFRVDGLVLGALLASAEIRGVAPTRVVIACLGGAGLLLGAVAMWPSPGMAAAVLYALLALAAAGILVAARVARLRCAPLEWLGERSYGVYLVHPFFVLLPIQHPAWRVVVVTAATAAVADGLWRNLERPILRWRVGHPRLRSYARGTSEVS